MTSEEYVNQVNRLIDLQNTYLAVFLTILIAGIGLVVLFQWRISTQQMKRLKEETKQETIKEIEEALGVSSLEDCKRDTLNQVTNIKREMENQVEDVKRERDKSDSTRLYYEIIRLQYEETFLWRIPLIMDSYSRYISDNIRNFNSFVSEISGLITHFQNEGKLKEGINSPHIDRILDKLTEIEKRFNEKSNRLVDLKKLITISRRDEK